MDYLYLSTCPVAAPEDFLIFRKIRHYSFLSIGKLLVTYDAKSEISAQEPLLRTLVTECPSKSEVSRLFNNNNNTIASAYL